MVIRLLAILAVLFAVAKAAAGASFESDGVSLDIPPEFQGPISQSFDANTKSFAYTRLHSSGTKGTLLQVTTYEFGERMPALSQEQLGAAAEKYLREFLKGVERRRQSFSASPVTQLKLGGIPAARIAWKGVAEGSPMHGVMYCVVRGSRIVTLHTQDFDAAPPEYLNQAVQSIEAVRFTHGG